MSEKLECRNWNKSQEPKWMDDGTPFQIQTDYDVIEENKLSIFTKRVNDALWEGYQLVGGMTIFEGYYYQAVVLPIRDDDGLEWHCDKDSSIALPKRVDPETGFPLGGE